MLYKIIGIPIIMMLRNVDYHALESINCFENNTRRRNASLSLTESVRTIDNYVTHLNFAHYSRLKTIKHSLKMFYSLMRLSLRGRIHLTFIIPTCEDMTTHVTQCKICVGNESGKRF